MNVPIKCEKGGGVWQCFGKECVRVRMREKWGIETTMKAHFFRNGTKACACNQDKRL